MRRKPQPLTIRTVQTAIKGVAQFVQDEKIAISRISIGSLQNQKRWPKEYYSYIGRETRNNRYKDPDRFFRVMHYKPEWFKRRFIFRPIIDVSDVLKQATLYANAIAHQQANMFRVRSGLYRGSFKIVVDGELATPAALDNLTTESVVQIYNAVPYASKLESLAFYNAAIGGVLYFAANKVKSRYPTLGVSFSYKKPYTLPETYGYKGRFYMVPVLTLGSRAKVIDTLKKPGNRVRRRKRAAAKTARLQNEVVS